MSFTVSHQREIPRSDVYFCLLPYHVHCNFYLRSMSSHHIVREKQEPALYIYELADFDEEYLGQLLEWSPTLLVAASQYEKAISLGLKVDVVIGDYAQASLQERTKTIFTTAESLQAGLKYLVEEKYPAVNIIVAENNFDDVFEFLSFINIVIFTPTSKSYPIKSGFSVWKPAVTIFKINGNSFVESTNLKLQKDGFYVVASDGFVSFNFNTKHLFLTEFL